MKRRILLAAFVVILLVCLLPIPASAQEIVDGDIGGVNGFRYAYQRKSFYAEGLYWVFVVNDTTNYLDYYTSADNVSWAGPTHIRSLGSSQPDYGEVMSIYYDGTYMYYYAAYYQSPTRAGYFRRGEPQPDGTISWSATEQTAISGSTTVCNLTVDSSGYAFLVSSGGVVYENANNDGTWSTASITNIGIGRAVQIVPLTNGKLVAIGTSGSSPPHLYAKRYTGSAWGSLVDSGYDAAEVARFSATYQDDDAHITFVQRTTNDICYINFSYSTNSFSGFTTIYDGSNSASEPTITRDESSNDLYVSWLETPTANHVYLVYSPDSGTNWSAPYDWVTDADTIPNSGYINCDITVPSQEYLNVYYIAGTSILKSKNLGSVLDIATLVPDPIGATTATLRGEILSLGLGSATYRCFYINESPEMAGATLEGNETGTFNVGVFTHAVSGLTEGEKYYVIAYASNDYGEDWGWWYGFTAGGEGSDIAVITLDPTNIKDTTATFNANLISAPGGCTMLGFEYGQTETATWEITEGGNFALGLYEMNVTGLQADSLYYVRGIAGNDTNEDHGQWVGFITKQPSYNVPGDDYAPLFPGTVPTTAPGGWIRPDKDYNGFPIIAPIINAFADLGFGRAFFWFTVEVFAIVVLTLFGARFTKNLPITFLMLLVVFLLPFIAFEYLDWWMLAPFILVGAALCIKEGQFSWS